MEQAQTLAHADTFFFVTTIAVCLGILILGVLLFIFIKIFRSVRVISRRVETLVNKTSDTLEDIPQSENFKKGVSFILPLASLFMKKKKSSKQ